MKLHSQTSLSSIAVLSWCLLLSFTASAQRAQVPAEQLNWHPRSRLSAEEQQALPDFCSGDYRPAEIQPRGDGSISVQAMHSERDKAGRTRFSGNVEFHQQDRLLTGDKASWDPITKTGTFHGQVKLNSPEFVLNGEEAEYLDEGPIQFTRAEYAVPGRHFRGSAEAIKQMKPGTLQLDNATFTFCEPQENDWDIAASELNLDQNRGIGSAWHARLRVADVPVLYLPYYRFPIGDQRMTGFLDPKFTFNGKAQAQDIQLPFYLNVLPNLDATITPHHILDRGLLWEAQLRHKTRWFGDGELNYGYLNRDDRQVKLHAEQLADFQSDPKNQGKTPSLGEPEERFLVNYRQQGRINQYWSHRWVYNNVSDKDYLTDMKPSAAVDRTTHLPRRGEILFNRHSWHFDITAESFQTIDQTIALQNRPYRRLPQLNLTYKPTVINSWQIQQQIQYTRFNRSQKASINQAEQTLSGFDALNGKRLLSESAISYPIERPYGFLTPKVEYRYRHYTLNQADSSSTADSDQDISHGSGRYSLDAGLYFDRELEWFDHAYEQTLEPRIFWVRSPFLDKQHLIPNFDTTASTVSFNSLFTGDRFTGGDRLADLNQISTGITSRFIRDDGLEQLRLSLGRIYYQTERRVQLTGQTIPESDQQATSSTLGEAEWNPGESWSLFHTLEWDPYKDYARQRRYGIRYQGLNNRMLNLATNTVHGYDDKEQRITTTIKQLDAGVFWALSDRWALVWRQLRDLKRYDQNEKRPVNDVLESLTGVEYQNCCWRVQLLYRTSSVDINDEHFTTDKRYGFMLSFQLKGLTTLGSGTDDIILDAINGYSRRTYHDY